MRETCNKSLKSTYRGEGGGALNLDQRSQYYFPNDILKQNEISESVNTTWTE